MTRSVARAFIQALVFAAAAGTATRADAQYTFTKINVPNSTWTEVSGINNSGQIVGTYANAAGVAHGFLYSGGVYSDLDFPGKAHNYALGIGNAGQVVGSFSPVHAIGPWSATLLENGVWSAYDFPERETDGRAINSSGHIVGIYNSGFGTPDHGFLKIGNSYTSIDYPGATFTFVFGLNDAGYIAGTYIDAFGVAKGFVYFNGTYSTINHPTATETSVQGINNANALVGWKTEAGKTSGYVQTGMVFRPVIVPFANAWATKPRALNDGGAIVGTYSSPECPVICSFLAIPAPSAVPVCEQTISLGYANGTLVNNFTLRTNQATTWTAWLFARGTPYMLWSGPIPTVNPASSVSVPISTGPLGDVVLVSLLGTAAHGTVCVDVAALNTSATGRP